MPVSVLSKLSPLHIPSNKFNLNYCIVLPSTPRSSKYSPVLTLRWTDDCRLPSWSITVFLCVIQFSQFIFPLSLVHSSFLYFSCDTDSSSPPPHIRTCRHISRFASTGCQEPVFDSIIHPPPPTLPNPACYSPKPRLKLSPLPTFNQDLNLWLRKKILVVAF